jgi:hypothetical protein
MELLIIIALTGLWVAGATVRAVLTDGRGHTPGVRSTEGLARRASAQRSLLRGAALG